MRHIGIVKAREELARNENLAGPLPLGFLSCLPRSKLVVNYEPIEPAS